MIHLICTLEPIRICFLDQFIEHYAQLGVEKFHFSLQLEPDSTRAYIEEASSEAKRVLKEHDLELGGVLIQPFSSFALRAHHDRLQDAVCRDGDWIVWSDIDEFQVYPGDFKSLIELAQTFDIDYFRGILIDRTTEDGKLKAFDPGESIWKQYPLQIRLHPSLPSGLSRKIVCARSNIRVGPGNHFVANEEPLCFYTDVVEIQHFKWDATVIRRLARRLAPDFQERCPWWTESKAILDFIEEHGGMIANS
jgi:glycosyl transferase family 2